MTSAKNLSYRDFITIGVILNKDNIFPDNWIYIHSPEINAGRLQNFKNWNPEMVPDPATTRSVLNISVSIQIQSGASLKAA